MSLATQMHPGPSPLVGFEPPRLGSVLLRHRNSDGIPGQPPQIPAEPHSSAWPPPAVSTRPRGRSRRRSPSAGVRGRPLPRPLGECETDEDRRHATRAESPAGTWVARTAGNARTASVPKVWRAGRGARTRPGPTGPAHTGCSSPRTPFTGRRSLRRCSAESNWRDSMLDVARTAHEAGTVRKARPTSTRGWLRSSLARSLTIPSC